MGRGGGSSYCVLYISVLGRRGLIEPAVPRHIWQNLQPCIEENVARTVHMRRSKPFEA